MKKISTFIIVALMLFTYGLQSQTILNSLVDLKDVLDDSNGDFKMTPGTYYFNEDNCGDGKLFDDPKLLFFTGSNNTFDFSDVKFEYDTEIFTLFGRTDVVEFWNVGNDNVYLNLTMEDIGNTTPSKGAGSMYVDGADNRIEGFKTTTRGSYPYAYGDIFGKGGGSVISHNKHAGILVRGESNHIKNCTILMRAYGHGIFMQGSQNALIEGCYVEGELRTVSEVLAEEGTGSPADNVDFETVWGFNLKDVESDNKFSLQEDGIRCYTTGVPFGGTDFEEFDDEGDSISRSTTGSQVKDCTVVQMRSGVTIGWDYTDKIVENCTVLACETGFWFGHNTTATNCSGDASIGPLVSEDVGRKNSTMDITILDNYVSKIGNTPHLYFSGTNHKLTLNDGTTKYDSDITLQVGGSRIAHRWLAGTTEAPLTISGDNLTFINNTKYPVTVSSNVSNSTFQSCGDISDLGSNNTVTQLENCNYTRSCDNTTDNLQSECYETMFGIETSTIGDNNEAIINAIDNNDWISYSNIDLTNISSVQAIASTTNGGSIEVRQGSESGTLLATISISNTNGTYETFSADLNQAVIGAIDVYFVFTGSTTSLFNLDKISFIEDSCAVASYNPILPIDAELFCDSSGVSIEGGTSYKKVVTEIEEGDYIKFSNVEFGNYESYNTIEVTASSINGGSIEVRKGSVDGDLLSTISIESTSDLNTYDFFSSEFSSNISETQDLYLVFKGTGTDIMNVDNFSFYYDDCSGVSYEAYSEIDAVEYCDMFGVVPINEDEYLGGINDKEWIRYKDVDFTSVSPTQVTFNVAGYPTDDDVENGYINVMLDHPTDGTIFATVEVPKTGGWEVWEEVTTSLLEEVTGVHDVYLYFGNGSFNLDWFEFHQDVIVLDNLALATNGAIASQSTTAYEGEASRANDGNTNGNYGNSSVSHTEHGTDGSLKWWQVDLDVDKTIYEVVIHNRTGSNYGEYLNNFTVEVINNNGDITFSKTIEDYPNPSTKINTNGVIGKIVKISKTSEKGITLAEVQVFGTNTLLSNDLFDLTKVNLSSNPVTNSFKIEGIDGDYLINIYDVSGSTVLSQQVTTNSSIDVKKLTSGLYFVQINKSGIKQTLKMIKKQFF